MTIKEQKWLMHVMDKIGCLEEFNLTFVPSVHDIPLKRQLWDYIKATFSVRGFIGIFGYRNRRKEKFSQAPGTPIKDEYWDCIGKKLNDAFQELLVHKLGRVILLMKKWRAYEKFINNVNEVNTCKKQASFSSREIQLLNHWTGMLPNLGCFTAYEVRSISLFLRQSNNSFEWQGSPEGIGYWIDVFAKIDKIINRLE